jgi:hypothetical protein
LLLSRASAAHAESWCATPLIAHEWGVQVFAGTGAHHERPAVTLPAYFHTRGPVVPTQLARVADLPPDSGIRKLPLLHFYAPDTHADTIPLGLGVGFALGAAQAWFPQVDALRNADEANSAASQTMRAALQRARSLLAATGPRPKLPDDLTRQLQWNNLTLSAQPAGTPSAAPDRWVGQARQLARALWVARGKEAERFVFYEAGTTEHVALQIKRGPSFSHASRQYVLENPTPDPVHDVVVVHREGAASFVAFAPLIAAKSSVTVVLVASSLDATLDALRSRWIEPNTAAARGGVPSCVMRRDPAIPIETASSHRLFAEEVDLLLATWAGELFEHPGTTIVYREDVGYLDKLMPLSLFTSMYHYVVLHRLGLAVWQNVVLP